MCVNALDTGCQFGYQRYREKKNHAYRKPKFTPPKDSDHEHDSFEIHP